MYRLKTELSFSAAHLLNDYEGECKNLHGHNWKVELFIVGKELQKNGMLIDFKIIKLHLAKLLKGKFDHKFLNEVIDFNPTAENLSRYIFFYLKKSFNSYTNITIDKVRVWENDKNYSEFFVEANIEKFEDDD